MTNYQERLHQLIHPSKPQNLEDDMIKTEIISLTPQLAAEFLKKNISNRPLKDCHVFVYQGAISRGEWKNNGDPIRFSKSGNMLDGQHRCHAVIKTGITIKVSLTTGLDDDVFDTIDCGAKRRSSDILSIKGEINATQLAAAARLIYFHSINPSDPFNIDSKFAPTTPQVVKLIDSNPLIRDSVNFALRHKWIRRYCTPSIAGFCYFLFYKNNQYACSTFFESLDSGVGLDEFSPVLALRDRLINGVPSKSQEGLTAHHKAALIFKAFRHYRNNELVKVLRIRATGMAIEKNLFTV